MAPERAAAAEPVERRYVCNHVDVEQGNGMRILRRSLEDGDGVYAQDADRVADETASHVGGRMTGSDDFNIGVDEIPESRLDRRVGLYPCREIEDVVVGEKLHIETCGVDFISDDAPDSAADPHEPAVVAPGKDVGRRDFGGRFECAGLDEVGRLADGARQRHGFVERDVHDTGDVNRVARLERQGPDDVAHPHDACAAGRIGYVENGIVVVVYHENLPGQIETIADLPRKDAVGDIGAVCQQRGEQ